MTDRSIVSHLIAEGALLVEDGNHGEYRPRPHEFVDHGTPFIRAADMTSGVVSFATAGKIDTTARARIRKGIGRPGDALLSHKGTVGKVAVAPMDSPDFVCSPQTTFWRSTDPARIEQRYVPYVLKSPAFIAQLNYLMGQTDMAPYVSLTDQRGMSIPLPRVEVQRGIAEVLGALDDKIAANTALAATSLELADAIFHRAVRRLAFGPATFEDVASIQGGGTPSTKVEEFWGGGISWATPTDVTNLGAPYLERTARTITPAGFEACSSALHPVGSIFMTSRATIGAFAIAKTPAAVNQGFIVVNAHDPSLQWWLFHEMRSRIPEFLSHANGATFLELSRGRFKKLSVRCPDDVASFQAAVAPIHLRARAAAVEAEHLGNTRDLLLPMLMSGKIRVKDAERVVEGVV